MKLLFLLFGLTFPSSSFSHPMEFGVLEWKEQNGNFLVSLQLNPVDVARFSQIQIPPPADWLQTRAPRIFFSTLGAAAPKVGNSSCRWSHPIVKTQVGTDGEHVSISAIASCPQAKGVRLPLPFLERGSANFRIVSGNFIASKAHPEVEFRNAPGVIDFVLLGIEHIGVIPTQWYSNGVAHLPEGFDHLLFILVFALGAESLISVLKSVSGFTFGHFITLCLISLQLISIPSRVVESGIALSILVNALFVVWGKREWGGWRLAVAMGMLHGLGFASALQAYHLSRRHLIGAVFGFNLGIEIAQLLVVTIALLFFLPIQKKSKSLHAFSLRFAAAGVAVSGAYWLVERAFA